MPASLDAIIVGAGHNGLVTACYLARAGWKVLVLERRSLVGGACVTEEVFPGFKVSTAAYVNSPFRKQITRDLNSRSTDLRFSNEARHPFSPSRRAFTSAWARRRVDASRDRQDSARKDARAYPSTKDARSGGRRHRADTDKVLPNVVHPGLERSLARLSARPSGCRGWSAMGEALEILAGPARPILDRWFESERSRRRWRPMPSLGPWRARRCLVRPMCCFIT